MIFDLNAYNYNHVLNWAHSKPHASIGQADSTYILRNCIIVRCIIRIMSKRIPVSGNRRIKIGWTFSESLSDASQLYFRNRYCAKFHFWILQNSSAFCFSTSNGDLYNRQKQ